MKRWLAMACLYAGITAAGFGETCGDEIQRLRGVWRSPEIYFPLYADWDTVAYLGSLVVKAAGVGGPVVAVLPIYGSEAVHFRVGDFVFVSTALIVSAGEEQDLIDAIRSELRVKPPALRQSRPRLPSSCAGLRTGPPAGFAEMQRRISAQVARYEAFSLRGSTGQLSRR